MKEYYQTNLLAEDLRRKWGIDNYSPINIFSLVQEKMKNLTLILLPMDNEISGAYSQNNQDQLILINSNHSKGRQNFTLAHELYHLFYENNEKSLVCSESEKKNFSEKEANNFGSSLLIPSSGLSDYMRVKNIETWTYEDIIYCEQYFQISHIGLLCRLRREKLISYNDFMDFKENVKREALKLGFSTDLYEPSPEKERYFSYGNYIRLTEEAYKNNKISIGKKEELLLDAFRSDNILE